MPILKDQQGDSESSGLAVFAVTGMAICWVGILMLGFYVHGVLLEGNCSLDLEQRHSNARMALWLVTGLIFLLNAGMTFGVAKLMLRGEASLWTAVAGVMGAFATAFVYWAFVAFLTGGLI